MNLINNKCCILLVGFLFPFTLVAQVNLLEELEKEQQQLDTIQTVEATFKSTRLINGQSVELRSEGVLLFLIAHRFGRLNSGAYEFFGLDEANMRMSLEYALMDALTIGIGRSSFEKTFDGFLKFRIFQQQEGARSIPISVVGFTSLAINTLRIENPERSMPFSGRLDYTHQLLIARKFGPDFSLQITPTLVHRNLVEKADFENNVYAMGIGGRMKITSRVSINAEYFYRFNTSAETGYYNPFAIGFDIETGGHVFQLHFTNARAMVEEGFLTETTGNFFGGDIHFGFNISRVFELK